MRVQLTVRPEPFVLSWDSRDKLLAEARDDDQLRDVVASFENAGVARPVALSLEDEWAVLDLLEAWAQRVPISELPAGIWDLRCALTDEMHDAAEGEQ